MIFFFQAEDGIRDLTVTGVQTCALPISEHDAVLGSEVTFEFEANEPSTFSCTLNDEPVDDCEPGIKLSELASGENTFTVMRSEERRVGKECRSRWLMEHQSNKYKEIRKY